VDVNDILTENEIIEKFPFAKQGVQLRRQQDGHDLLGKRFFREWVDVRGRRREVHGTITKCWQGLVDQKERFFTVEYDDRFVQMHKSMPIPTADNNVSEAWAWGGYVAYEGNISKKLIKPDPPFHWNWIIPAMPMLVPGTPYPSLVVRVDSFELSFFVKESGIPKAGLGLWVVCKDLSGQPTPPANFVLRPGQLVDLRVYGPCQAGDLKSEIIFLLKEFIHTGSVKAWSFERASHESGYIDLTDDWSGEVHEKAKNNLVALANETNGKNEIPSMFASHDPSGAVHYFLGHSYPEYGALTIPVDTPTELKASKATERGTDLKRSQILT
jgi:hypothetical protein